MGLPHVYTLHERNGRELLSSVPRVVLEQVSVCAPGPEEASVGHRRSAGDRAVPANAVAVCFVQSQYATLRASSTIVWAFLNHRVQKRGGCVAEGAAAAKPRTV